MAHLPASPLAAGASLPPELYQGSSRCFAEERWSSLEHRRSISKTTILWVPSDSHRLGCFWHWQAAYIRCDYLQDGCMLQKRYIPTEDLKAETSSEVPPQQHHTPLWVHISLHFFCAALALLAADFGLLSIQCGICWEIYVLWLLVMLIAGMLQAFHGLVHLPSDAAVPDLGKPIVTPVLPILGNWPDEPLSFITFWIFLRWESR